VTKPDNGPSLADFRAYLPTHNYVFMPTGMFWSGSGVNACLHPIPVLDKNGEPVLIKKGNEMVPKTVPATTWLDWKQPTHHLTWAPGYPPVIENRLIIEGQWINRNKIMTLNLYRPPIVAPGDPKKAGPWLDLAKRIYPDDHERIIRYVAHRVQRPGEKPNHGLLLIGAPGIGKDTLLEPVKYAVGPHNFREASPQQLLGRFNGFLKAVVLRVSEVCDLGEFNRYQFYEHAKTYLAAPPDMLRIDEKFVPEHQIVNCCGVIFTSNYLTGGIYLPADDRRHDVMKSDLTKENFEVGYWDKLWGWYGDGGLRHVAAYLATLDLSKFNPKAPPPKTKAFWAIVDSNRSPEESELEDVLDDLRDPDAVTLADIIAASGQGEFTHWLEERKNRRVIPHRLERVGYCPVRNPDAPDSGLWRLEGIRQVVYAKALLPVAKQLAAAQKLVRVKAAEKASRDTEAQKQSNVKQMRKPRL
jgi:hypothetical protein